MQKKMDRWAVGNVIKTPLVDFDRCYLTPVNIASQASVRVANESYNQSYFDFYRLFSDTTG